MNLQKLQDLLPKQIKDLHLNAEVGGEQVCKLWQEYAEQLFMARTTRNHEAINFREGVLTILVSDSETTKEIRSQQHKIVSHINRALGKPIIISVRFRL